MKFNSIFSVFTPKETKFFPMLAEAAEIIVDAGACLELLFTSSDKEHVKEICQRIKNEEIKGDKVTGRISKALNNTFITPFDREDIHALSDIMDDVIDAINRTAQQVMLYSPEICPDYFIHIASIIKEGGEEIKAAVSELSNLKKYDKSIRKHCKSIKKLEEAADSIYEKGILSLFHEEISTVELIKLKEILSELERSVNIINSTGKILKTILIKYA